jgi:hypothetical protein
MPFVLDASNARAGLSMTKTILSLRWRLKSVRKTVSLRRMTRRACTKERRSGSLWALSADSCMKPGMVSAHQQAEELLTPLHTEIHYKNADNPTKT